MKKICLAVLLGMFCICACTFNEESGDFPGPVKSDDNISGEADVPITNTTNDENGMQVAENVENSQYLDVPLNTKAEEISYVDDTIFVSPFISDGKDLFLRLDSYAYMGKAGFYTMPVSSEGGERVELDFPEGADIGNLAIDTYGRVHLLITDRDNEKHVVWRLDDKLQIEKHIDISGYSNESRKPSYFMIDKDDTFYVYWGLNEELLVVDSEGAFESRFTPESLGIKHIQSIGIGKDGHLYIAYENDGRVNIGKLGAGRDQIVNANPDISFPNDENITMISRGTDTDMLIYGTYGGVWACDIENGSIENRVPISDIGFGADADFYRSFLPDGRLLINTYDHDTNQVFFKYIPVGR